jgi:hypothetical protein
MNGEITQGMVVNYELLFLTKECGHFAMTTWEFMGIGGFL